MLVRDQGLKSSKPHSEERFYDFLFLYVKKDQMSNTLLPALYILLKKHTTVSVTHLSPTPPPVGGVSNQGAEAGRDYQGVGRREEGAGKLSFPCD